MESAYFIYLFCFVENKYKIYLIIIFLRIYYKIMYRKLLVFNYYM